MTVRGQKLNLRQARFDWLEMAEATRRNKHTIMLRLSNSVMDLGGLAICFLWGSWLMLVMDALMLLWAAAVYHWLMTKGVQVFDRLGY
ncbi:MAG: hypothetical protein HDQ87_09750 [Clostridia bacterium]|nr:hypothetical protein [Clostridia bacterium]